MPVSGGAFEQAYNAQASVDIESGLIITRPISQSANDAKEILPTLNQLKSLEPLLGKAKGLLGDTGYFSASNVLAVDKAGVTPYIAFKREVHNLPLQKRFQADAPEPEDNATPLEWMKWRMQTKEGRAIYSQRKHTIEPTFGIQKEAMGYRRFLVRGLANVSKEWDLVCLAFNLRKLFSLKQIDGEKWLALLLYCMFVGLYLVGLCRQKHNYVV